MTTKVEAFLESRGISLAHSETNTQAVIVALPSALEPIRLVGDEEKHATLLYFGETSSLPDDAKSTLINSLQIASKMFVPFSERITGVTRLGTDDPPALVAMLHSRNLEQVRNAFMINPTIDGYMSNGTQYPTYQPHITLAYPDYQGEADIRKMIENVLYRVSFDRLALWWNDERIEFDLTNFDQPMSEDSAEAGWSEHAGNFLAHLGIKGMKWGVRRSSSGSGSMAARDQHVMNSFGKFHKDLGSLNNSSKYKGKDLSGADKKLRASYDKDAVALLKKHLDTDPSGTKWNVSLNSDDSFAMSPSSSVQHADVIMGKFVRTSQGLISSVALSDVVHAIDLKVSDFLAHHGIKGMKWGIRKSDPSGTDGVGAGSSTSMSSHAAKKAPAGTIQLHKGADGTSKVMIKKKDGTWQETHLSADAERAAHITQKAPHEMSDRDLREAVNRANTIKQYNELFGPGNPNAALQAKVTQLQLQKQYIQLHSELHPKRPSPVQKLIGATAKSYDAFSKLDKLTAGELSKGIGKKVGGTLDPEGFAAKAAKDALDTKKGNAQVEKALSEATKSAAEAQIAVLKLKERSG